MGGFPSESTESLSQPKPDSDAIERLVAVVSRPVSVVDGLVPRIEAIETAVSVWQRSSVLISSEAQSPTGPAPFWPSGASACLSHRSESPKFPSTFQIFVSHLTPGALTFDVGHTDSIRQLKLAILSRRGYPVEEQRLVFGGRALEDH
jgi:hypothetical protein